jgi:histidinol-phosphate phosphatase family protein
MPELDFDIVIPTVGRPSLHRLIDALGTGVGPMPRSVIVADDRTDRRRPLGIRSPPSFGDLVRIVPVGGRGPAAARNVGIAVAQARWTCFLDDDVVPSRDWRERLAEDVRTLPAGVAGSQGRVRVPLPDDRRATDWERNVRGLEGARWATADMAYRRDVLLEIGGFDERFPRAYREDADLALRVLAAGHLLARGRRGVLHPVRPAGRWVSLRMQAGNADDALMRARHGPAWRRRAGAPRGRFVAHLLVTASAAASVVAAVRGRPRAATAASLAWIGGTLELAWARIAPGPCDRREVARMIATSVLLPPVAVAHRAAGWVRVVASAWGSNRARRDTTAVLFDRDGTLVIDVPYNGDAGRVRLVPGAREALHRLRRAGVPVAVITNQSGVGRGLIGPDDVEAVNRRIEDLAGPIGPWLMCFHAPEADCSCRKPRAGLVLAAADRLGVEASRCIVVGDTEADVLAASAAGARAILIPNAATRAEEIARSHPVASGLQHAVDLVLGERASTPIGRRRERPPTCAE